MSVVALKKKSPMHLQNIKVVVRIRPLSQQEEEQHIKNVINVQTHKDLVVREKKYTFDRIFKQSSQIELYLNVIAPLIQDVVDGYNCTVFAYGQTGSGKTFTMTGDKCNIAGNWRDDDDAGLIPRVAFNIFEKLHNFPKAEFSVKVSYIELYNEEIRDLLSDDENSLNLFNDTKGNLFIQGLTEISVLNGQGICKLLQRGIVKRQIAPTLMNHQSSRSHTIFIISVNIIERTISGGDILKAGKINLVDLAGSENIARSGCRDIRAMELANINRSLLTLGRVIHSLADKSQKHVPYRDSKLTRILQDSLGGHTKTVIIATVSPAHTSYEETVNTLEYATRARDIKNTPIINEKQFKNDILDGLVKEINRLQKDLDAARTGTGFYVNQENFQQMLDAVMAVTGEVFTAEELEVKKTERLINLEQIVQMRVKQFEYTVEECKQHVQELVKAKNVIKELEYEKFLAAWYENESNEKYVEAQHLLHATNILNNEKEILLAKLENQFSINVKNETLIQTTIQDALTMIDNFETKKEQLLSHQQSEIELKHGILAKQKNHMQNVKQLSEIVTNIDRNAVKNISVYELMHPIVSSHINIIQNKLVALEKVLCFYSQNIESFEKLFSELSNSYRVKTENLFTKKINNLCTHNNIVLNDLSLIENKLLERRKRNENELELEIMSRLKKKDIEDNDILLNHIRKIKDNIKTFSVGTNMETDTEMSALGSFTTESIEKLGEQANCIYHANKECTQKVQEIINLTKNFIKHITSKFLDLDNSQKQITEEIYDYVSKAVISNCVQIENSLDSQTHTLLRDIIDTTGLFIKYFNDFISNIRYTLKYQILEKNVKTRHIGDTPIRQSLVLPKEIKELVPRTVLIEQFKRSPEIEQQEEEEEQQ